MNICNNNLGSFLAKASLAQFEQYFRRLELDSIEWYPSSNLKHESNTERPTNIVLV